jgi:adenosylmethionine-8-amino-7-oxononanoate aminotransferase
VSTEQNRAPVNASHLSADEASRLYELDRTHWLHPQGDLAAPIDTVPQLIMTGGHGATLTDVEGREYIDAMASLWNVNVGYGRHELADAAAEQMKALAFSSAYGGFGTEPAIKLAAKIWRSRSSRQAARRPTTPPTRSRGTTGTFAENPGG